MEYRFLISDIDANREVSEGILKTEEALLILNTFPMARYIGVANGIEVIEIVVKNGELRANYLSEDFKNGLLGVVDNMLKDPDYRAYNIGLSRYSALTVSGLARLMAINPERYTNKCRIYNPSGKRSHDKHRSSVVFIRKNPGAKESSRLYPTINRSRPDHRYDVTGFWRKCSGLGKDQGGVYNQHGRTWVNSHIRGFGEYIYKPRIVKK
jgi:hypothetical protein